MNYPFNFMGVVLVTFGIGIALCTAMSVITYISDKKRKYEDDTHASDPYDIKW